MVLLDHIVTISHLETAIADYRALDLPIAACRNAIVSG